MTRLHNRIDTVTYLALRHCVTRKVSASKTAFAYLPGSQQRTRSLVPTWPVPATLTGIYYLALAPPWHGSVPYQSQAT